MGDENFPDAIDPPPSYRWQGDIFQGVTPRGGNVNVEVQYFDRHAIAVGVPGAGKTAWLATHAQVFMNRPGTVVVVDSQRDLLDYALWSVPFERRPDVVIIKPTAAEKAWGCNLLQAMRREVMHVQGVPDPFNPNVMHAAAEALLDILSSVQEDAGGQQAGYSVRGILRFALLAALERIDTTLVDVYAILTQDHTRRIAAQSLGNRALASYLTHEYPALTQQYRDRAINKLQPLAGATLANLFSRRDECQSLTSLLEQNKIIFVDLDHGDLGIGLASFVGYFVLVLSMMAADKRHGPEETLQPLTVIVDEFSDFASNITARWFAQGRKKKARLIAGFQSLSQLPPEVLRPAMSAGIKAAFRCTYKDAKLLCEEMNLYQQGPRHTLRTDEMVRLTLRSCFLQYDYAGFNKRGDFYEYRMAQQIEICAPPKRGDDTPARWKLIHDLSDSQYAKPYQAGDLVTVYDLREPSPNAVLECLYAATFHNRARRAPGDPEGEWVTRADLEAALDAFGTPLSPADLQRFLGTLQAWGSTKGDGKRWGLTTQGWKTIQGFLSPGQNPSEGGLQHQQGVLHIYGALQALTPVGLSVPRQEGSQSRPDLLLDDAQAPHRPAWVRRLTDKDGIWFQYEHSTLLKPEKILGNIEAAHTHHAEPVIVVRAPAAAAEQETYAELVHERIMAAWAAKGRAPRGVGLGVNPDGLPYRLWLLAGRNEMLEHDPASRCLRSVRSKYVEGKPDEPAPQPATAAAPPPKSVPATKKPTPTAAKAAAVAPVGLGRAIRVAVEQAAQARSPLLRDRLLRTIRQLAPGSVGSDDELDDVLARDFDLHPAFKDGSWRYE
jgi:hypothetical protein